jgi:hypothetical protein
MASRPGVAVIDGSTSLKAFVRTAVGIDESKAKATTVQLTLVG